MKKIILFLILFVSPCYAENWVCYDPNDGHITQAVQGDCLNLGLCSDANNQGLKPNCFEAKQEEFEKAKESFVKFDASVVTGNKIVDLSDIEKDMILQDQAVKQQAQDKFLDDLKNKFKTLGFSDEEIQFLTNK
jgi:hypothetical protein